MKDEDRTEDEVIPADESSGAEKDLDRLRDLLLGKEQEQIRWILERLDDPSRFAHEIGEVLPPAISHAARSGPHFERALAPTMERATRRAIETDTKTFADALFPVMGPAIRRSIAEALKSMIQSLNQALEHSLSVRGLRWRLEALRTGRSFGEVVLSHTLVYRVEQIFLIHPESGLLLHHLAAPEVEAQDADMVSGMLTAIQDFVRDSFKVDRSESLQTMEVGDLQVWVEQGPRAVLAAAVRGSAPVELRQVLREALEAIHLELAGELSDFEGDAAPFDAARHHLDTCLRSQAAEVSKKASPLLRGLALIAVVLVGWWLYTGWSFSRRLDSFLTAMRAEPGMVVAEVEKHHRYAVVRGLRDPLARDPARLIDEHRLTGTEARIRLQAYQSLDDSFVAERARQLLQPPLGTELSVAEGVLTAVGAASAQWAARAREMAPMIPGLTTYDDQALTELDADAAIRQEMDQLRSRVEAHTVVFDVGSAEIDPVQAEQLTPVVEEIAEIIRLTERLFSVVRVQVEGYADPTGTPELNVRLSRERAETVVAFLSEHGIPDQLIQPVGRGTMMVEDEENEEVLDSLRKVTFKVEVSSDTGGRASGEGAIR